MTFALAGGARGGPGGPPPDGDQPVRATDRRLLRRVAGLFRPYTRPVAVVAVAVLISSGLGAVAPLLIKYVFDNALFAPGGPDLGLLGTLVGAMVAIAVVAAAVGVYQAYLTNRVGQRVMRDLRDRLYQHLQGMPLRFFTATRTGEIQSRLANDVGGLQVVITETASTVLANVVLLLSTLAAMLVLSWQLTALSLVMVPLFGWLTVRVGRARRRVSAQTQTSLAEMSAITQETLSVSGVLLSKVFGRQGDETRRYAAENERLAALQVRQQMIGRAFFAVVSTFFSITPALTYLTAGLVADRGAALSAGTLVAFTTLQTRLFFPIGTILETATQVSSSLALFDRIFAYLDLRAEITDAPDARPLPQPVRGRVQLDAVSFDYDEQPTPGPAPAGRPPTAPTAPTAPADSTDRPAAPPAALPAPAPRRPPGERRTALSAVSLTVEPGMLAAIVGPSGAGKTTISYLIPRLYDVTAGRVLLDGVDVREVTTASIADAVGMVTQESYLFHASIRSNLAYARPDASDEEVRAAARAAYIHERILEFPDGYDTVVGERGYRLSGGEKQRLAIARVVLKDPRVLILDEATSALDTGSERVVQQALQPLMAGRTTIAIAHRLSTILAADVIFVLDRGRLVEQGTHAELVRLGGRYAGLYEQQFGGGLVEARCLDGFVLASGQVLHAEDPGNGHDGTAAAADGDRGRPGAGSRLP